MFTKSAKYYDLLYGFKDYRQESASLVKLLKSRHPAVKTVLDVGCGTAEHHRYLRDDYAVDGVDINEEFLSIARGKNPNGRYWCADMVSLDLGEHYDVVVCLFSSIGYVGTIDRVAQTLACFRRHLNSGGVAVVEPWITPQAWKPGKAHMLTAESDDVTVCRMNVSGREGNMSFFVFHYLIGTPTGVTHFTERHELGLFTVPQMKDAFTEAGLAVQYDPEGLTGRGLYIARAADTAGGTTGNC